MKNRLSFAPLRELLLHRLVHDYVTPYKKQLAWAVLAMTIVAMTTAAHAWMIKPALDHVFLAKNADSLSLIIIAILVISVVKGFAGYGQNVLMKFLGQRIVADMQLALYRHLLRADLAVLTSESSGRILSRFTNDITIMRNSVSTILTGLARDSISVIFLIGVMFYQSPILSLIAFTVFPIAIYPLIRMGKRMRKIAAQTQENLGHYTAQLDDTFQNIRIVKSYGREDFEDSRATSMIERIVELYMKAARTESGVSPLMESLSGIAIAAVIGYGGMEVVQGTTTPGAFFSFIGALLMAYKPMKSMADLNTNLQEGLAAANRLFTLLDKKPHITDASDAKPLHIKDASITFNHVSFGYEPLHLVLNNLSFTIPSGKMVALVGPSGGGKSTIFNLLLRFWDPTSGSITIDGQNIAHTTLASLRQHIALVTQDIILFDDTVKANIAYGKLNATDDEIVRAAKEAAAHDFIMALPDGYDTQIGQHGQKLSGGQRQRLSIARAILKKAPILLLDEATSALDNVSEKLIQKTLQSLRGSRTILVIAHRLSTIQNADLICVIENGTIRESDTHENLLEKQGIYTKLYVNTP